MSDPLHVLIVDDNPQDRALAIRELRREFADVDVRQAIDQAQLDRTLHDFRFDVVITDYQLQWSDGIRVLRQVKSSFPDCPVLMFTATGNEEIAVEALKGGLDDYIVKKSSHFVRLRGAVRTALEHRDMRRRAVELEARLESLLSRLDVGVFRCTADGRVLEANAPVLALLGSDSADASSSVSLACLFDSTVDCLMLLDSTIESGEPQECEIEVHEPSGRVSHFRLSVVPARTSTGEAVIDGLAEDITARKRSESEARQAAVASARVSLLSSREKEVLDAVAAGKANKVIARDLQISEKTVEKHRANLTRKLQAKSVAELVRLALAAQSAAQ
ncbi:MAG: response regulator [Planctomycetes bacterium]|nr:response regulator [Planctomycetota bacterium]MBL7044419.1 response regulator [Pirellulaceae bacterium]